MRPFKRTERIASLIKEVLGNLIVTEVGDPRVQACVITHVKVSADMSIARIYVRPLISDEQGRQELLAGLASASGFLRSALGHRIRLLRIPELKFHYDEAPDEAARVEAIIASITSGEKS